ncbi:hypothetical protein EV426DRAFT_506292, partial [Tirmania nivea]
PYHKVPNTYLGNVCRFEECTIYIFFPHLYYEGRPTNYLMDDQMMRFFNLLLKTITDCGYYNSAYIQHLLLSVQHAKEASYAKFRETGLSFTEEIGRQQSLHYYLPLSGLAEVLTRLRAAI